MERGKNMKKYKLEKRDTRQNYIDLLTDKQMHINRGKKTNRNNNIKTDKEALIYLIPL